MLSIALWLLFWSLKENHIIKLEMLLLGLNKLAKCLVYSRYSEFKFSSFLIARFLIKLPHPILSTRI